MHVQRCVAQHNQASNRTFILIKDPATCFYFTGGGLTTTAVAPPPIISRAVARTRGRHRHHHHQNVTGAAALAPAADQTQCFGGAVAGRKPTLRHTTQNNTKQYNTKQYTCMIIIGALFTGGKGHQEPDRHLGVPPERPVEPSAAQAAEAVVGVRPRGLLDLCGRSASTSTSTSTFDIKANRRASALLFSLCMYVPGMLLYM